jgi:hypothetical protein
MLQTLIAPLELHKGIQCIIGMISVNRHKCRPSIARCMQPGEEGNEVPNPKELAQCLAYLSI